MSELAIKGGKPIRTKPFPAQVSTDDAERQAVLRVLDDGRLTGYQANWSDNFYGGREIRALEEEWADKFKVRHAIAINSATSGLHVACGAVELSKTCDVVVTPYSMTCSATAPIIWGADLIFADIENDFYCLNIDSMFPVQYNKYAQAIIIVDLFGQPYDIEKVNAWAKKNYITVIEDAAQAIGSKYKEHFAGTLGNIGVYSLNFGKHITCGEGGIIVTNDDDLALRCRLLLNHAEAVVNDMPADSQSQFDAMFGFNLRMTELQAAVARCQLRKLDWLIAWRQEAAEVLRAALSSIPAISPPKIRPDCTHVFYVQAFKWNKEKADGLHRDKYIEAVKAELAPLEGRENEGVPIGCGYIKPIYKMPLFASDDYYDDVKCPVAERMWSEELFLHRFVGFPTSKKDLDDVASAFHKVWDNRKELLR